MSFSAVFCLRVYLERRPLGLAEWKTEAIPEARLDDIECRAAHGWARLFASSQLTPVGSFERMRSQQTTRVVEFAWGHSIPCVQASANKKAQAVSRLGFGLMSMTKAIAHISAHSEWRWRPHDLRFS
jgi:hypothetical protein